jgi:hypothetical protein
VTAGFPTAEALVELLRRGDPMAAARAAGAPAGPVRLVRADPPGWLVDGDEERPEAEHRRAHGSGRPSVAAVAYGDGVPPERTAARLASLATLAGETGLLRAVCPVPSSGSARRPGSWGVEDLTVIAAARAALPASARVRPHWRRLGPAACQIALAFGADEWAVPDDDRADLNGLAEAVGRELAPGSADAS